MQFNLLTLEELHHSIEEFNLVLESVFNKTAVQDNLQWEWMVRRGKEQ